MCLVVRFYTTVENTTARAKEEFLKMRKTLQGDYSKKRKRCQLFLWNFGVFSVKNEKMQALRESGRIKQENEKGGDGGLRQNEGKVQ